ncbi:MAG: LptF/LptG family permease [Mailhella sp.]|nr:LptF/LptG family permease [Mailhella sp.]
MKLLSRKIFLECFKVFIITLGVLLLFILLGRAMQLREMLLGLEMGFADVLKLFACLSPFFLSMLTPVACMLAVFLTFLRMSTDRELIALKAGGVSLYQLLPAPLFFAVLCMLFSLWLSLDILAMGMSGFRQNILDIAENRAKIALQPGTFNRNIPGMVLFVRRLDTESNTLADVMIEDRSVKDGVTAILAPRGSIDTNYGEGSLVFLLKDGTMFIDRGNGDATVVDFGEYAVSFSLDGIFKGIDLGPVRPKEMAWSELRAFDLDEVAAKDTRMANKILVEMNKRLIFPLACLVLTIFALPLATAFEGVRRQTGLVLGLIVFLVYYAVLSVGISMGESAALDPLVGMWLPSGLFMLAGMYGIYLVANERMPRLNLVSGAAARLGRRLFRRGRAAG